VPPELEHRPVLERQRAVQLREDRVYIHALVSHGAVGTDLLTRQTVSSLSRRGSDHGSIDDRGLILNIAFGTGRRLRAAFATLLALALLGTLVAAQTASAATLSQRVALSTAKKLVKKQLSDRTRKLTEARIGAGKRLNSSSFAYLYDDLNRDGDVCAGTILVRLIPPGGNTVQAEFSKTTCKRPGDEALAFRAVARSAGLAFLRAQPAVARSVSRYVQNAQACEKLKVPRDRVDEATVLLSTGLVQAANRPLRTMLDDYATTLQSLGATDAQLGKGAAAWRDYVDGVKSLPTFSPGACSVLAAWAANGYSDATAPADFAALSALTQRLQADGQEIRRTARHLVRLGIDPVTGAEFTLDNLAAASTTAVARAGAVKAAARALAR
jgi:hypothetical protein